MVYCGKPSKGCQTCRDKKTRCDRATPSCGQCIRANRPCPGYRSQLDLMFRNESDAVIGKAKAREKSKSKPKSPSLEKDVVDSIEEISIIRDPRQGAVGDLAPTKINTDPYLYVQSSLPTVTMFPSVEERGLAYFNTLSPTWLRDSQLLDDITSQKNVEEHLLASMSAVGLASFSNSVHAPHLMVQARKDYVNALQLTNTALRSPKEAKKDSTLFAVMILGIFETITGSNERSLGAWAEHINGAAALIKLRGRDQFKSQAGLRMFMQVTSNLMLSCVQRTVAMPQHILDLRPYAEEHMEVETPAWASSAVIIDFTIYRAAIRENKIVGPRAIIEAGLEIDRKFIEIWSDLSEEWHYETIYTDKTPHLVWNGRYHVYKERWMAHIYNGMRTCRVLIHEVIRDQLLSASMALTPIFTATELIMQGEASVAIMREMQADILASIPNYSLATTNTTAGLIEGSRSYFMLWPLYLVGAMDLTTGPIREWAAARLRDIGENIGIRQALVVADYLKNQSHISVWDEPNCKPPKQAMLERNLRGREEQVGSVLQSHFEEDVTAAAFLGGRPWTMDGNADVDLYSANS